MTALLLLAFAAAPPPALVSGRLLDDWLGDLAHPDPLVAEEAALVLADVGPSARAARPALRRLLNHPAGPLRTRAALALWRIGRDPSACLVTLGEGLRRGHSVAEILATLADIGPAAAPAGGLVLPLMADANLGSRAERVLLTLRETALPALLRGLLDPRSAVRRAAAGLIVRTLAARLSEDDLPAVRALLRDRDRRTRMDAAQILFAQGEESAAVYAGLALALDADPAYRSEALRLIDRADARPAPLLPALLPLLSAADLETRLRAALLVFDIEKRPARVLPVYRKALTAPLRPGWPMAIWGMGRLGPAGHELAPRVVELMAENYDLGWAAGEALSRVGPETVPLVLPLLVTPPAKNADDVREAVFDVLADHGPTAVKALGPLLDGKDEDLAFRVFELIARLGPDSGPLVPKLLRYLRPGARGRFAAASALEKVGPAARAATEALRKLTESPDDRLTHAAALRALASIGVDAKQAGALAAAARKHADSGVRAAGLELLCRRAPGDPAVGPYLREALGAKETRAAGLAAAEELRPPAAERAVIDPAWAGLGTPGDGPLRRRFEAALRSRQTARRVAATAALGLAGEAGRAFAPQLRALLADDETRVRAYAAVALWRVSGDAAAPLPVIRDVLRRHRSGAVRATLAGLLAEMGLTAKPAAPALRELINDPERDVRFAARRAVAAVEGTR